MRYMKLSEVQEGMLLGKNIFSDNGSSILIFKDTPLHKLHLERLAQRGHKRIYIEDYKDESMETIEAINEPLRSETIDRLKHLNIDEIINNAQKVVAEILDFKDIPADVFDVAKDSNFIFNHSLVVTELAVLLGKYMDYDNDKLYNLAIASLLHDVGKMCEDKEIMKKCRNTTINSRYAVDEDSEYNEALHTIYAYNILDKNPIVPAVVKQGVLCHHENVDGSGLLGLSGDKIYEFAKVIRLCDVYEHLISNDYPNYKLGSTSEVIEYIVNNAGRMFDKQMVTTFVENMSLYPVGITVILSDGRKAIVVANKKGEPIRPTIRLESDPSTVIDLTDPSTANIIIMDIYRDENEIEKSNTK